MWLSDSSLNRAVKTFLMTARIPRPDRWNPAFDEVFIENVLKPAFVKALAEIEEVNFCAGFPARYLRFITDDQEESDHQG